MSCFQVLRRQFHNYLQQGNSLPVFMSFTEEINQHIPSKIVSSRSLPCIKLLVFKN